MTAAIPELVDIVATLVRVVELLARGESSDVNRVVVAARTKLDGYRATWPPKE